MSPQSQSKPQAESVLLRLIGQPAIRAQSTYLVAKAALYGQADPARNVYYIHHGQVRIYQDGPDGTRRLVEILGGDQWCGLTALAGASHYGEGAETTQPSMVSVVPTDNLLAALAQDGAAAVELLRIVARKLTRDRHQAAALVFEDCRTRLLKSLLELAESPAATKSPDGVMVQITQLQLAQKVGVTRETCSLTLSKLRRGGILQTGRNKLTFKPDKVRAAVDSAPR